MEVAPPAAASVPPVPRQPSPQQAGSTPPPVPAAAAAAAASSSVVPFAERLRELTAPLVLAAGLQRHLAAGRGEPVGGGGGEEESSAHRAALAAAGALEREAGWLRQAIGLSEPQRALAMEFAPAAAAVACSLPEGSESLGTVVESPLGRNTLLDFEAAEREAAVPDLESGAVAETRADFDGEDVVDTASAEAEAEAFFDVEETEDRAEAEAAFDVAEAEAEAEVEARDRAIDAIDAILAIDKDVEDRPSTVPVRLQRTSLSL